MLIEQYVVVGDTRDAEQAARLWNFTPKSFQGYHDIPSPVEIERRARAESPLPEVYGDWAVGTDPAKHVNTLRELFESGATIVNVHTGQPDQRRVIDFYGTEVLPKLAARA